MMPIPAKKVVVFATALRQSGGLTIYRQFLAHLMDCKGDDEYVIFKDAVAPVYEMQGVTFIDVDTASLWRRMYFDLRKSRRMLHNMGFDPDAVISLQNFGVWSLRHIQQYVYYHNSLAFSPLEWSFFKKRERVMFLQKHIYPLFARISFTEATVFYVQTDYVKQAFEEFFNVDGCRVFVCFPDINSMEAERLQLIEFPEREIHFIYPATPLVYKNHINLVYVLSELRKIDSELLARVRIHLTINEDAMPRFVESAAANGVKDNFVFEGMMNHYDLLSAMNSAAGLLFPSELETVGLPLVEAASLGLPIIVSDLGYSHAVVGLYPGAFFVRADDYSEWADLICRIARSKPRYPRYSLPGKSSWNNLFSMVHNGPIGMEI